MCNATFDAIFCRYYSESKHFILFVHTNDNFQIFRKLNEWRIEVLQAYTK